MWECLSPSQDFFAFNCWWISLPELMSSETLFEKMAGQEEDVRCELGLAEGPCSLVHH